MIANASSGEVTPSDRDQGVQDTLYFCFVRLYLAWTGSLLLHALMLLLLLGSLNEGQLRLLAGWLLALNSDEDCDCACK